MTGDILRGYGYDPDHPVGRDDEIPDALIRKLRTAPLVDEATIDGASSQPLTTRLSPRELEVLRYASRGLTVAMIADALGSSPQTVKRSCLLPGAPATPDRLANVSAASATATRPRPRAGAPARRRRRAPGP